MKWNIAALKPLLRDRMTSLVPALGMSAAGSEANGWTWAQWQRGVIYPRNPTRVDNHPGSFAIWVGKDCGWKDYATGEQGDVFDLVAYCLGLSDREAIAWVKHFCGIEPGKQPPKPRRRDIDPAEAAAKEAEALQKKRRQALGMWLAVPPGLRGTLAEVYFRVRRGIELSEVKPPLQALRFSPRQWFRDAGDYRDEGAYWPALIALMSGADGRPVGTHRTFLARDGSDKAPYRYPRKMWPALSGTGAHVRISKGESGLTPEQAIANGLVETLLMAEGVDDGVALARAYPRARIWSWGSLALLAEMPILPSFDSYILFADNDQHNPQAMELFERGRKRLADSGAMVEVVRSPLGKDISDLVRLA
ncbi:MAG TPA: hypothetical protein PLJ34_03870 [Hyphomicrobiales bacterium]|nr:hypothetical protein [Hyphomicrobiales bacterium]